MGENRDDAAIRTGCHSKPFGTLKAGPSLRSGQA